MVAARGFQPTYRRAGPGEPALLGKIARRFSRENGNFARFGGALGSGLGIRSETVRHPGNMW